MPILKVITVVQARMGSSRFPGKVMLPLADKPLLLHMVERVKASKFSGKVIVATTFNEADDEIETIV